MRRISEEDQAPFVPRCCSHRPLTHPKLKKPRATFCDIKHLTTVPCFSQPLKTRLPDLGSVPICILHNWLIIAKYNSNHFEKLSLQPTVGCSQRVNALSEPLVCLLLTTLRPSPGLPYTILDSQACVPWCSVLLLTRHRLSGLAADAIGSNHQVELQWGCLASEAATHAVPFWHEVRRYQLTAEADCVLWQLRNHCIKQRITHHGATGKLTILQQQ
mmetsp:Transcript_53009/g.133950  ORF Transcript_53009/g.133950 Transcript_53009/m.133950 type:complete len:216 (-) Transcript_53009:635-1282(-)